MCIRMHASAFTFHCFLYAFIRAAFYKSVAFERILQPLGAAAFFRCKTVAF
jgi:hypothetical protein